MSVPLQDPAREYRALREPIREALLRVPSSGRYVGGRETERLEEELAAYLGVEHVVTLGSGTDALALSLRALGVGRGDQVVVPAFTFFATAEAVLQAGAEPVFADIRPGTFALDPRAVEKVVTERTAALIPVHLFGQMADLEALQPVADRHELVVVEDAAQAMGAACVPGGAERGPDGEGPEHGGPGAVGPGSESAGDRRWARAGALGAVGCFSFYPTKNLGGFGDGGAVATDDGPTASRLRRLRDHGRDPEAEGRHLEVGWNSRLSELQAAVLRVKLEALEEWNGLRRRHARDYDRAFDDLSGIVPPRVRPGCRHVYHQYTVRCEERDRLAERLAGRGIGYGIYYPVPVPRQPALSELSGGRPGSTGSGRPPGRLDADRFPEAERAAEEVLSLPVFPLLEDRERRRVIEAVRGFAR